MSSPSDVDRFKKQLTVVIGGSEVDAGVVNVDVKKS